MALSKEKMWKYLRSPHTTKKQGMEILENLAEYMFERGWIKHKTLRKQLLSWEAQKMKEDFDAWYDQNIDKYPLKDLDELREIWYSHIPQTHSPK